ncbi:hypothetical protein FHW16_004647 [Phyllobacterium myrsinacearum]|uniref:Uncharacterized protein n=1 Tax=Phyllobacterium myrsinacearum TaxID=28101 RepID=A0A839EQ16_9HYPH|nr:hypothetical protein [Phyllobacterium myrsinacearum]
MKAQTRNGCPILVKPLRRVSHRMAREVLHDTPSVALRQDGLMIE